MSCSIDSAIGRHQVTLELLGKQPILHWKTSLTPIVPLTAPFWPRDIYPIDGAGNPLNTRGIIHAQQQQNGGAFLFCTLTHPAGGSFLYLQNLSALNDYFEKTHTSCADRISGLWPELGFSPPAGLGHPLPAHEEVILSDAYVLCTPEAPRDDLGAARLFLELYAELYLVYPRPEALYRDWPRRVHDTIYDLSHSPLCTVERSGHRYLLAYVGADDRPPESIVQLAVLLPLIEYARKTGEKIPLIDELKGNLPTFYDPKIGSVVRWLPSEAHLLRELKEDHMSENVMDSWYLHHSYLNLARLALDGDATARQLFLGSVEYGIKVAHHFAYCWPVFYDLATLDSIKVETSSGPTGEPDVAAQYVHIMQQAWKLTGERRYVEEAEQAAQALQGLGFNLGYQFNNTSFGAGALVWLWRLTGKQLYLELSHVCLANIVQNFWLWQCKFGYGRYCQTFMGLPPLKDSSYLAIYEELEMLAAFHEYLEIAAEATLPALRVLLPEYCRYLIDRAWNHYPGQLPRDMVVSKTKSGRIERDLSIPLEDLNGGWRQAGEVGQQVYGAAAPFVFSTRHFHRVTGAGFLIYCGYPVVDFKIAPRSHSSGSVSFHIQGDHRCTSQVRIVPEDYSALPPIKVFAGVGSKKRPIDCQRTSFGHLEFVVPGNAIVRVEWAARPKQGNHKNGSRPDHKTHGPSAAAGENAPVGGRRNGSETRPLRIQTIKHRG